jgi:predicted phage terminase large subunit-like protein
MNDAALLDAVLRQDFLAFVERMFREIEPGTEFQFNWHYQAIAHQLMRVMNGECRRLIINVPPRSGKSLLASIAWPMFIWGHRPTTRMICVSHTEGLARDFSIKRKMVAQSDWYRQIFPGLRLASARDLELTTTQLGSCYATGVGGGVLGRGADVIIIDDPLKGLEAFSEASRRRVNEFFDNTLITRLNDKVAGAIVIIMQRLHEDDLVGHVCERGDWEVISFPAIAHEDTEHPLSPHTGHVHRRRNGDLLHPEREPLAVLEELRRAQGSLVFESQYQQRPTPADGNVIKRDWLRYYDNAPERFDRIVVSWDTASTLGVASDYSVGTVWGSAGLNYYLLDVVREKAEAPDLRRRIVELDERWQADISIIEDGDVGRAITQELRRSTTLAPLLRHPRFDKRARLEIQSSRFEAGQVYLPKDAPWLGVYIDELLAFPAGKHDDQVDSTSQALDWLTARDAASQPVIRRDVVRRRVVRREVVPERRR